MKANIHLIDNIEFMAKVPDKYYELAIVDPPYGINFSNFNRTNKCTDGTRIKANKYKNDNWDDSTPKDEYFIELQRISKNQIVWGGNYFKYLAKIETPNLKTIEQFNEYIKNSDQNWIFWHKQNPVPNFADGELAWTSFKYNKQFDFKYYGNLQGNTSADTKIHPTQKAVELYKWLLQNYANPNDKIFDSHCGSGSSIIACIELGYDIDTCEIDKDYYNATKQRINNHVLQLNMFHERPQITFFD